jgi:uncharacterized protein
MPNTRTNAPRGALVFDLRTLGRQAGSARTKQLTAPAPDNLGLELARVPVGADMQLDVRFEAVTEGVLVTGSATAPLAGECARCLGPLTASVTVDFTELYLYADGHPHDGRRPHDKNDKHDKHAKNDKHDPHDKNDRRESRDRHHGRDSREWFDEDTEQDDEEHYLVGDLLDLEPVLRDAVVLALPMSPLCREDCPGLCVECGVPLAEAGPGHTHEEATDPRWAGLKQFDDQTTRRGGAIDIQEG